MELTHLIHLGAFGLGTVLFRWEKPILGTIILTDKCNLHCKHCPVNNLTAVVHPYGQIRGEMERLFLCRRVYRQGPRHGGYAENLPAVHLRGGRT